MRPSARPVLVLAPPNYLAPLAVMRSLHALGAKVYAPRTSQISLWSVSRYCAGTLEIGVNGGPSPARPEETVAQLLAAGRRLGGDVVLLPCSDEWTVFVAQHANQLVTEFRFSRLDADLAHGLTDKLLLQDLAASAGVGVPPSVVMPATRAEAKRLADSLEYPVMVKTVIKRANGDPTGVVMSPDQLVGMFDGVEEPGNLVCQRWIAGGESDGWLFNGYFDAHGRCLVAFSGRKLRQWPLRRGITVFAEATRNAEVEELAIRFLSTIGYSGPVDLDFIRDPADGRYWLLDVNPRIGGVFRLFTDRQGLDVARAAYLDLAGEAVEQAGQRESRRFFHDTGYLLATVKQFGRQTPITALREFRRAEMGMFRLTDPLPFLLQLATTVGIHARARLARRADRSAQERPLLTQAH